ncbi:hypothetical protein BIW11_03959, partial [Tropilaelaps mercedesae]
MCSLPVFCPALSEQPVPHQAVTGLCAPLETAHSFVPSVDPLKCLPLSNRYPDLLTSSNLVQFEDDLRSSTSTLHSAADMESNCSASPMIRRLQAHIRARASFRMACAAPLSCSSEDDRDVTLTREATPPPQLGASQEKILPEDYQLVFITSSESFSDLSDYDEQGRKRRRKKKRSTLKVKSRLEVGSGAYYIEDSEWEFTSDSDYRMAASLWSLDEISDVEENIKEKAKIIELKSASLEDLPSLFTRTGSVRLKRNNSLRRSMRKSMRLKNNPLLMKQKKAEEAAANGRECHKCGGVKSRAVAKTATGAVPSVVTGVVQRCAAAHPDEAKDHRQDDTASYDIELDLVEDQQRNSPIGIAAADDDDDALLGYPYCQDVDPAGGSLDGEDETALWSNGHRAGQNRAGGGNGPAMPTADTITPTNVTGNGDVNSDCADATGATAAVSVTDDRRSPSTTQTLRRQ